VSAIPRARRATALLPLLLVAAACRREPLDDLPAGTLWSGDAAAARSVLASVARLESTPVGIAAAELDRRLAHCRRFLAHCPPGRPCDLASTLTCQPEATNATLARKAELARGDADWLFVRRDGERRLAAWGKVAPGGELSVRATFDDGGDHPAAWEGLLPARRAPGPPVLSDGHVLLHVRLRPEGGVASLAPATASTAGQLYGIDARLLASMALEGTSELAVYDPVPDALIPPMALAVHVRERAAAIRGMEALLAHVHQRWGATRVAWKLGPYEGACLADVNVLPELAPCYVATDRALVVGWNQLSVAVALLEPPIAPAGDGSTATVELARFAGADARLRASWRSQRTDSLAYPWKRMTLSGSKRWSDYELALRAWPAGGAHR
jgi:hypothetical protein